jgi:hypothetical protein
MQKLLIILIKFKINLFKMLFIFKVNIKNILLKLLMVLTSSIKIKYFNRNDRKAKILLKYYNKIKIKHHKKVKKKKMSIYYLTCNKKNKLNLTLVHQNIP